MLTKCYLTDYTKLKFNILLNFKATEIIFHLIKNKIYFPVISNKHGHSNRLVKCPLCGSPPPIIKLALTLIWQSHMIIGALTRGY